MANISATPHWPGAWGCTPSLASVNGTFTIYNAGSGLGMEFFNYSGVTMFNACIQQLMTADSQLRSAYSASASSSSGGQGQALQKPFWETTTPLIFTLGVSTASVWFLFLVTLLAHSKRPWLQRLAAVFAAITITLAADTTYREMIRQYYQGSGFDSNAVRAVHKRTAQEVLRIISNTLLWLAEVQIVLRLFARQRDKTIVRWTGAILISLAIVFASFNQFYAPAQGDPGNPSAFVAAIPVLAYLFHIAIGVLYAACIVLWSALGGRLRHAYHITLVPLACVSIAVVCIPVVFFCLDIWKPEVEGWGDYIRWAGLLASSVVVWDWIDLVQGRQMRDKKNGVLGREVYEEEMEQDDQPVKPPPHQDNLERLEAKGRQIFCKAWQRPFVKLGAIASMRGRPGAEKDGVITGSVGGAGQGSMRRSPAGSVLGGLSEKVKKHDTVELPTFHYPTASNASIGRTLSSQIAVAPPQPPSTVAAGARSASSASARYAPNPSLYSAGSGSGSGSGSGLGSGRSPLPSTLSNTHSYSNSHAATGSGSGAGAGSGASAGRARSGGSSHGARHYAVNANANADAYLSPSASSSKSPRSLPAPSSSSVGGGSGGTGGDRSDPNSPAPLLHRQGSTQRSANTAIQGSGMVGGGRINVAAPGLDSSDHLFGSGDGHDLGLGHDFGRGHGQGEGEEGDVFNDNYVYVDRHDNLPTDSSGDERVMRDDEIGQIHSGFSRGDYWRDEK